MTTRIFIGRTLDGETWEAVSVETDGRGVVMFAHASPDAVLAWSIGRAGAIPGAAIRAMPATAAALRRELAAPSMLARVTIVDVPDVPDPHADEYRQEDREAARWRPDSIRTDEPADWAAPPEGTR